MARTALDLTMQEWQAYHPGGLRDGSEGLQGDKEADERRRQAWRVARRAGQMLREQFGASKVVVFGSLAHGWFTPWSDIDLAAWGILPDRFYVAVAAVTGFSAAFRVDLLDPETCRPVLREALEREGVEL